MAIWLLLLDICTDILSVLRFVVHNSFKPFLGNVRILFWIKHSLYDQVELIWIVVISWTICCSPFLNTLSHLWLAQHKLVFCSLLVSNLYENWLLWEIYGQLLVRDHLQVSHLIILSELITIYFPCSHQETIGFLMISGEIEANWFV